jgi:hypothetical protein
MPRKTQPSRRWVDRFFFYGSENNAKSSVDISSKQISESQRCRDDDFNFERKVAKHLCPSWSKGFDSSSNIFVCVGSNPTGCNGIFFVSGKSMSIIIIHPGPPTIALDTLLIMSVPSRAPWNVSSPAQNKEVAATATSCVHATFPEDKRGW